MRFSVINNERGSALLVALTLLGLVFMLGAMAIENSRTESDLSFNKVHLDEAFYVAQAGGRHACSELMADPTWTAGFQDRAFGDGEYSVVIVDSTSDSTLGDTVVVRSTGTCDGASSAIEFWLVPGVSHPFEHAFFAKSSVEIKNGFTTDSYNSDSGTYAATRLVEAGDVGSNGLITVHNGAYIGGDVASATLGGTDVNGGATVTGTISDTAPERDVPEVPQSEFDWAETVNDAGTGMSGSYTYDAGTGALESTGTVTLNSGVYYFSSIILKNSAELVLAPGAEVTIYITGDIEMKNSSAMNEGGEPGDLLIYSQGDFVLKNSGGMSAVFYSPNGSADLRNSGDFYGSIVANDIIAHNSANFHYDRRLGQIERESEDGMVTVAYREI